MDEKGRTQPQQRRQAWSRWLRVAAGALVLLALSEVLWLWQTWPVRAQLQPPVAGGAP